MKTNVLIIGAGITGILASRIFSEFICIEKEKDIKGKINDFILLHKRIDLLECKPIIVKDYVKDSKGNLKTEVTKKDLECYNLKIGYDKNSSSYISPKKKRKTPFLFKIPKIKRRSFFLNHKLIFIAIDKKIAVIWDKVKMQSKEIKYNYLISTIPLFALISILNFKTSIKFKFKPIYVKRGECELLNPNIILQIYAPYKNAQWHRATTYLNRISYEFIHKPKKYNNVLSPGKIYFSSLAEEQNKNRLLKLLKENGIYCVGRYAQWNYDIQIHHNYQELLKLEKEWHKRGE